MHEQSWKPSKNNLSLVQTLNGGWYDTLLIQLGKSVKETSPSFSHVRQSPMVTVPARTESY